METGEFGARLRELRKQAGFSQRELASKIGVNFSYLSKIESGAMPPPSEKVLLQLADVLNADKDELLTLAGKIPADIAQILKNRETLQFLRSRRSQQKVKVSDKIRGAMPKHFKSVSRVALAIILVAAIGASLWFASPTPVKALEIAITDPTGATLDPGTIDSTYSFRVKLSIEDNELFPIRNINLKIYNVASPATYYDQYTNLSLGSTGYVSYTTSGTGTAASIKATPDSNWEYFTTGAGYVFWQGTGYTFAPIVGGYGYASGTGTTSITYDIQWTPFSGWPTGAYKIEAKITAQDDQIFTKTSSSFTLSAEEEEIIVAPSVVTPEVVITEPGVADVSAVVTNDGVFTQDVVIESEDGKVEIAINEGTTGLTKDGKPLSEISITEMVDPPDPPLDANIIGLTVDLGPDGAVFPDGIELTFTYDPDELGGVNPNDLVIAIWDEDAGAWVILDGPFIINTVLHTIKTTIFHFTPFTVLAELPPALPLPAPAAFTTSALTISPTEVDIGESVTISVLVANTGELSGSYKVTLKVDNVAVATEDVTLAGAASQTVTFSTTRDAAGTYTIDVNGLSGTFTVKTPAVPAPPSPINWWLIAGIVAGVIVIVMIIWLVIRRRRY